MNREIIPNEDVSERDNLYDNMDEKIMKGRNLKLDKNSPQIQKYLIGCAESLGINIADFNIGTVYKSEDIKHALTQIKPYIERSFKNLNGNNLQAELTLIREEYLQNQYDISINEIDALYKKLGFSNFDAEKSLKLTLHDTSKSITEALGLFKNVSDIIDDVNDDLEHLIETTESVAKIRDDLRSDSLSEYVYSKSNKPMLNSYGEILNEASIILALQKDMASMNKNSIIAKKYKEKIGAFFTNISSAPNLFKSDNLEKVYASIKMYDEGHGNDLIFGRERISNFFDNYYPIIKKVYKAAENSNIEIVQFQESIFSKLTNSTELENLFNRFNKIKNELTQDMIDKAEKEVGDLECF